MKTKLAAKVAAGFLGSILIGQAAQAQMQMGGNTGSTAGRTGGATAQNGSSSPLGGSSTPGGLNIQSLDFNQGTTAAGTTTGSGAGGQYSTSRNARSTRNGRSGTSALGSLGLTGLGGGGLSGGGRGGTSSTQTNRQTERHAQYGLRMDLVPLSQPSAGGPAAESIGASTAQVRSTVERSVGSIVGAGAIVTMDGSNAIISGAVGSEYDRKLAERMALLVPGVDSVRNELVVKTN